MSHANALVPLSNEYGWTSEILNQVSEAMVAYVRRNSGARVVDIGAGLGVATLPALAAGGRLVANDISEEHLVHINARANLAGLGAGLTTHAGRFPTIPDLGPFDVAHLSNVLHFLSGAEVLATIHWLQRNLHRGAKVFIQTQSPFCGHNRAFLPVYMDRRAAGLEWPGEIDDAPRYYDPLVRSMTPKFMHVLEAEILGNLFAAHGFDIEWCAYYTRVGLPEVARLDGRENLGLIVRLRT